MKVSSIVRPTAFLLFLIMSSRASQGQVLASRLWGVTGPIYATALSGDTLYVGGNFRYVGPNTGAAARVDSASGSLLPGPAVDVGVVDCTAPDGNGGYYLGGDFTSIGGAARNRLAHVRGDGTLDDWNPGADSDVSALAFGGSTVYVGGVFSTCGGAPRSRIAALDAVSGAATSWNPGAAGEVSARSEAGRVGRG